MSTSLVQEPLKDKNIQLRFKSINAIDMVVEVHGFFGAVGIIEVVG